MSNKISLVLIALASIIIAISSVYNYKQSRFSLSSNTSYYAFLLSSSDAFYASISKVDKSFIHLDDVYFVQTSADKETKEIKNTLYKRGGEWHAPQSMMVNREHIVFIEPVNKKSKVNDLIQQIKSQ